jgi:phosphinothricin acetyltransferase
VLIRNAEKADLPAVTDIYNHYVTHSHATFDLEPFTVEQRRSWLAHYAADGPHRLLVGECDGIIAGYASSSPFRPKPAYRSSVETSIYLHPDQVGRGRATRLYATLIAQLARAEVHRAYAGIALPNDASIALHRRLGFEPIGTYSEAGYKHGRYIDVQWYQRELPGPVPPGL